MEAAFSYSALSEYFLPIFLFVKTFDLKEFLLSGIAIRALGQPQIKAVSFKQAAMLFQKKHRGPVIPVSNF